MICEEVKINLHDYVDELLDELTKRDVEYHIRNCDLCFKEYQKMLAFFERLRLLPVVINPPKEIIEGVKSELMNIRGASFVPDVNVTPRNARKIAKEKEKQEKKLNKERAVVRKSLVTKRIYKKPYSKGPSVELKRILYTAIPLALIAFGYFVYDFQKYNYPWQVVSIAGNHTVNGRADKSDKWDQGETLSTDDQSKAIVTIPKVGTMEVGTNSLLVLDRAKDGANQVYIKKGSVSISNTEDMPDYSLIVDGFEIIDRGGKFELAAGSSLGAILKVNFAFVEIPYNGNSFMIDENHTCVLRKGKRPGTPIHVKASDSLRAAVELFDFGNGGEASVERIISLAKEEDMLTLLSLIPHVQQLQRQILFQEISNRFPPPENVTRAGIIRLESEMLYRWWEEIEWQL
ncbi:MAG: zf-HC2 domain-containing protein [Melioribacteraceae bacterium]